MGWRWWHRYDEVQCTSDTWREQVLSIIKSPSGHSNTTPVLHTGCVLSILPLLPSSFFQYYHWFICSEMLFIPMFIFLFQTLESNMHMFVISSSQGLTMLFNILLLIWVILNPDGLLFVYRRAAPPYITYASVHREEEKHKAEESCSARTSKTTSTDSSSPGRPEALNHWSSSSSSWTIRTTVRTSSMEEKWSWLSELLSDCNLTQQVTN